jgi:hypothetical protein
MRKRKSIVSQLKRGASFVKHTATLPVRGEEEKVDSQLR